MMIKARTIDRNHVLMICTVICVTLTAICAQSQIKRETEGTPIKIGSEGTPIKIGSEGTPIKIGSEGTPIKRGSEGTPIVRLSQGVVNGKTETSFKGRPYYSYRGIPYAKPPVGALRFKAPVPVSPGEGDIDATKDGPQCMQKNYLLPTPAINGQEDCLYVNVYTPQTTLGIPLPVMVYIHGGGWFTGTGASYINGPDYLMDKDVVLVSFNYRLGALGFLSTGDVAAPGNYAMKDQVEALRWVRDNVVQFGGDSDAVTIFGQSAGAASVHYQMLSPMSQGLFHRAISQSGSALCAWAWPSDPLPIARAQGRFVGCKQENSQELIECLRGVDATNLTDSGDQFHFWSIDPLAVYGPVVEHLNTPLTERVEEAFLIDDPMTLIKSGRFAHVPWLVGTVDKEGIIRALPIVSDPVLLADLNANWTTLGPRLLATDLSVDADKTQELWSNMTKFYVKGQLPLTPDKADGFIDMYSDRSFVHGIHKSSLLHSASGHDSVYMYLFNYRGLYSYANLLAQNPTKYGTSHCDDLIYLFRSPLLFPDWPANHPDLLIMDMFTTLWTNFAKYGHPSQQPISTYDPTARLACDLNATTCDLSTLSWCPVSTKPGAYEDNKLHTVYMSITRNETGSTLDMYMQRDLHRERMAFWDEAPLKENSDTGLHNYSTLVN